jgi:hypothetical protein
MRSMTHWSTQDLEIAIFFRKFGRWATYLHRSGLMARRGDGIYQRGKTWWLDSRCRSSFTIS